MKTLRVVLTAVAGLLLLAGSPRALAMQADYFHPMRVGETIQFSQFLGGRSITGFRVDPDIVLTVKISPDRRSFQITCDVPGKVTLTITLSDGTQAVYRFECSRGFADFAPAPGGTANDALRLMTGGGTSVIFVDCRNPLACVIANQGRQGGFTVQCIGTGTGEGIYRYKYYDPTTGELKFVDPERITEGRIRARCPRD